MRRHQLRPPLCRQQQPQRHAAACGSGRTSASWPSLPPREPPREYSIRAAGCPMRWPVPGQPEPEPPAARAELAWWAPVERWAPPVPEGGASARQERPEREGRSRRERPGHACWGAEPAEHRSPCLRHWQRRHRSAHQRPDRQHSSRHPRHRQLRRPAPEFRGRVRRVPRRRPGWGQEQAGRHSPRHPEQSGRVRPGRRCPYSASATLVGPGPDKRPGRARPTRSAAGTGWIDHRR